MLSNRIARVHHNRVPKIGAIVVVHVDDRRCGGSPAIGHRFRRFQVESYPGFRQDKHAPFSDGHLVNIRALDSEWRTTVAAHWCEELE
jgi:hypothetical protein